MDRAAWDMCEFWDVFANVFTVGIELDALADRIKHSVIRRSICATARRPLPTMTVAG